MVITSTPYFDAYELRKRSNLYRFEKNREKTRLFQEFGRDLYTIQPMNEARINIDMIRVSRIPLYTSYECDPLF
jgi:hypothetical protein